MSKESENFKKAIKGYHVTFIYVAINALPPSVKHELMEEFRVSTVEELALKLKQYGR